MFFAEKLRRLLFHVATATTADSSRLLKGMPGRGPHGYGHRLRDWLAGAQAWLGEPVEVEYYDSPQDHGVDVLITGLRTAARVGIQIKSDNDLRSKTFQRELKAQITDSLAFQLEQLVVIFACDPYPPNEARIQYFAMESRRYQAPQLLVLPPVRAAGLLVAFDKPLDDPVAETKGWPQFFDEVGQGPLVSLYVDRWQPLLPEERFVEPACLETVRNSVATDSITCLVGPPAAGKTFLAALIAYSHWRGGKPVAWIAPPTHFLTDGPIANLAGLPDASQRVAWLTRQLGLIERLPPLDPIDFAAKHFQPDSLVYIEDPFGRTAAEYTSSLHTYPFFDLNEFMRLLSTAARSSTRVLITSREGLFERWLSELPPTLTPAVSVIRLKPEDYTFAARLALVEKLAQVRVSSLAASVARRLAEHLETPFEVEQCVQSLPPGATEADAISAATGARQLRRAQATALVCPDTDNERLFILCLCLLRRPTLGRQDIGATYRMLFDLLCLPGDASEALEAAMAKYAALVTRTPIEGAPPDSRYEIGVVHSTVVVLPSNVAEGRTADLAQAA